LPGDEAANDPLLDPKAFQSVIRLSTLKIVDEDWYCRSALAAIRRTFTAQTFMSEIAQRQQDDAAGDDLVLASRY